MKSLITIGILTLLIIGICVAGIGYVNHAVRQMEAQLQDCIVAANQNTFDLVKSRLAATQNAWNQYRNVLMMYTDQEILDEIDDHLSHMAALAEHHKEEFVPTAVLCIGKIQEMQQRESPSVYSWF